MELAPIVVFAYKRPMQLRRMLDGLALNDLAKESGLIIYCDGPRSDASDSDRASIEEVRACAHAADGFANVEVIEATVNKGLARSVIDGVTTAVEKYGRTIVVEDDAVLSPFFLRYMNDALDTYAANDAVFSVGAWNYYAGPKTLADTYFIRYPDSLAWATWKRSWTLFEKDGKKLIDALMKRDLLQRLDGDGQVGYFSAMLKAQVDGRIDSWAIRWTASCILHEKLNIFPKYSVALNKGFGAGATHEKGEPKYYDHLRLCDIAVVVRPMPVREDAGALASWVKFVQLHFEGGADRSLKTRIWRRLPEGLRKWYSRLKDPTTA